MIIGGGAAEGRRKAREKKKEARGGTSFLKRKIKKRSKGGSMGEDPLSKDKDREKDKDKKPGQGRSSKRGVLGAKKQEELIRRPSWHLWRTPSAAAKSLLQRGETSPPPLPSSPTAAPPVAAPGSARLAVEQIGLDLTAEERPREAGGGGPA
jgi:hypothetical protein